MTPLIPSGRHWITAQDTTFVLSDGTRVVVPKGYVTDGHTMPPILGVFINPYSYDLYAALLHDWLYDTHIVTRKQADKEYLRLMFLLGSNFVRRYSFYLIVRLVGWIWWRNKMV